MFILYFGCVITFAILVKISVKMFRVCENIYFYLYIQYYTSLYFFPSGLDFISKAVRKRKVRISKILKNTINCLQTIIIY